MGVIGSISVEALLQDSKFKQGIRGMITDIDKSKKSIVEASGKFKELGGILDTIGTGVKAVGTGLLGFLTSAIAMSPQFKEMFLKLKPILMDLGNFLGPKLKPVFDGIVKGARSFVEGLKEIENRYHIIETVFKGLGKVIDFAININEVTGGWAGLFAVGLGAAGAVSFIAGKIGLSTVATAAGGTAIAIPIVLTAGAVGVAAAAGEAGKRVKNLVDIERELESKNYYGLSMQDMFEHYTGKFNKSYAEDPIGFVQNRGEAILKSGLWGLMRAIPVTLVDQNQASVGVYSTNGA